MSGFSEEEIEFIRQDLTSGMGYSKIKIINDLIKKLKKEGKTDKEIWEGIKQFRKENGWDD